MRGLLAIDGIIYQYMMKVYDLIVLNLIFVVASLPLITIGASITALYDITLNMQMHRDKTIYTAYLNSFQKNFKQATQVWIGSLLLISVAAAFASLLHGNVLVLFLILGVIVIGMMALIYTFAMIAKFKNSTANMIRNGWLLAMEYMPYSIIMLSIAGILVIAVPLYCPWAGILSIFLTFSLTAYIQSYFLTKVFTKVQGRKY